MILGLKIYGWDKLSAAWETWGAGPIPPGELRGLKCFIKRTKAVGVCLVFESEEDLKSEMPGTAGAVLALTENVETPGNDGGEEDRRELNGFDYRRLAFEADHACDEETVYDVRGRIIGAEESPEPERRDPRPGECDRCDAERRNQDS